MSAFVDYLDLRLAVSEAVGRTDISDVMPRFTKLAESYLNKELRVREMETKTTLTFTGGLAPLPDCFLEVKTLWNANGIPMRGTTEETVRSEQNSQNDYSINGTNLYVYGLSATTRDMVYYEALPTLTVSTSTSNWLLQKHENLYLYAVALEAAKWMRDIELVKQMKFLLDQELLEAKRSDTRARWGNALIRPMNRNNP
jgi:hypothetical protein